MFGSAFHALAMKAVYGKVGNGIKRFLRLGVFEAGDIMRQCVQEESSFHI